MNKFGLTAAQRNIWNLQKYYEDTAISTICGAVFFEENIDEAKLNDALNRFIENQEGIRLQFYVEKGIPCQYVSPYENEVFDLRSFDTRAEYELFVEKEKADIFVMDKQCKLYRFFIVKVNGRIGILGLMSHLIADAWTFALMAETVASEIRIGSAQKREAYSYISHIEREEEYKISEKYKEDARYWNEVYDGKPQVSMIKPESERVGSVCAARYEQQIGKDISADIRRYGRENGISSAMLFEAAMYIYLGKINPDNSKITIGTLVLNRAGLSEKKTAGMFVSTMPMTVNYNDDSQIVDFLNCIKNTQGRCFRHQKYPYEKILESIRQKHGISRNIYDVMFSFQNSKIKTDIPFHTEWYDNGYSEVALAFHIDDRDLEDLFHITIDYQTEIFDREEIQLIYERIIFILNQIISGEHKYLREIKIIPDDEYGKLVLEFNNSKVEYQRDLCVHELFKEQVDINSDKVAIVFEGREFTYAEIDDMSNSLAHILRGKGVGRGDIVPIISERSWHVIVAMLGIMKAGGAYLCVSPDYPIERKKTIVEMTKSKISVYYGHNDELCEDNIELNQRVLSDDSKAIENINKADDLCYLVFTSGSTGMPKGVMIRHRQVNNYCKNVTKKFGLRNKNWVAVNEFFFDIIGDEILYTITNGKKIILTNSEDMLLPEKISALIDEYEVDSISTTPTKMKLYMSNEKFRMSLHGLKLLVLGGEALPEELIRDVKKFSSTEIHNSYGPSETTVFSTDYIIPSDNTLMPSCKYSIVGVPVANTQIYIINRDMRIQPIGVPGELCIAGEGVGGGYISQAELTAEKFIKNPFATKENNHGEIIYRTGDLARWRADGNIEYFGRIDNQVKIRGLRIELGEIENIMSEVKGVELVAATAAKEDSGRQYLVGYYTGESEIEEKEIRRHLSEKLPKYMIPNYFVRLDVMPMTPSGKIDRKSLPKLQGIENKAIEYVPPVTEIQKVLCEIAAEVLRIKKYGIKHDFFESGGDSLAAIDFVVRAESRGIALKLQMLFDNPTVEELENALCKTEICTKKFSFGQFEKYKDILSRNSIENIEKRGKTERIKIEKVLLTGATGYLGAHILNELILRETCDIYCLVREKAEDDGTTRFKDVLQYYFGDEILREIGCRIKLISGDITREGLSDCAPNDVDVVIHAAASVKHYGKYDYFYKMNTVGTKNVAEYAKNVGAKMICVSTISVSGNSFVDTLETETTDEERIFSEKSLYQGQELENVYVRSKFEAECEVFNLMLEGLEANIVRVGNLTNRSDDYKFQPNYKENAFLSRVRALLDIGIIPDYLMPLYCEFSPIDDVANAIVKIVQHFDNEYTVFHVNSNKVLYFNRLVEILRIINVPMEIVSGETFLEKLKGSMASDDAYVYEAFVNDIDNKGRLAYDSNIHIDNDFTIAYLKQYGFEWTEIDIEYIKGYVEYLKGLSYGD